MFTRITAISISKLAIIFLMSAATVFSQNITNTLGTGGLFTIKDASTNYLTLNQSTGQVNILKSLHLEYTTSSSVGIIFKGGNRFMHDYGLFNTFLGLESGNFIMTGFENVAVGENSLNNNTTGDNNTALGSLSLTSNTTGDNNTALGFATLYSNTSGPNNTAVGYQSLFSNTIGQRNTAVGLNSLLSNNSGDSNTALGYYSLFTNSTGNSNLALGNSSLRSNSTGSFNTAVGLLSLSLNSTGILNTVLGYTSGSSITTGGNLTCLGYNAEPTSGTANNQITLGNGSVTSLRCNVQTITSLSDARDKKNIKELSLGLDFIMKIKPRLFNWDKREWYDNNISDGSKMNDAPTAGFIAQELDEVQTSENAEWLNLVLKDNPEKLEATYGNLLPVMVKAIQELKVESEKLKVENTELKSKNTKLTSEIESLKLMNDKIVKLEKLVNEMNIANTPPAPLPPRRASKRGDNNENQNQTISKKEK